MPVARASRLMAGWFSAAAVLLAGCTTSGNSFTTSSLRYLQPGQTTLQEASALLEGDPVNVYRQLDGSAIARWAHTSSVLTDALYFNEELWLEFDAYGRFQRIVKGNNIPMANLYEDGRRVDQLNQPPVHTRTGVQPAHPAVPMQSVAQPAQHQGQHQGQAAGQIQVESQAPVSYPLVR